MSALLERLDALDLAIHTRWSSDDIGVTACGGRLRIAEHPDGHNLVTLVYEQPLESGRIFDVSYVGDLLQCIATLRRQLRGEERRGAKCLRADIIALSSRDAEHYWQARCSA